MMLFTIIRRSNHFTNISSCVNIYYSIDCAISYALQFNIHIRVLREADRTNAMTIYMSITYHIVSFLRYVREILQDRRKAGKRERERERVREEKCAREISRIIKVG